MLDILMIHCGPAWARRASSRDEISRLVRAAGGCGADFMLFLTDDELWIHDVWRLPRQPGAPQGFPAVQALRLASAARAAGMVVVQERDDPVPRRPDLDLTDGIKDLLAESGIELLDHLLIARGLVSVCRPK